MCMTRKNRFVYYYWLLLIAIHNIICSCRIFLKCGRTALIQAANRGRMDTAHMLIDKGANLDIKDEVRHMDIEICEYVHEQKCKRHI